MRPTRAALAAGLLALAAGSHARAADTPTASELIRKGIRADVLGRDAEAIEAFSTAIALDPANAEAHRRRGEVDPDGKLRDVKLALADLDRAVDLQHVQANLLSRGYLRLHVAANATTEATDTPLGHASAVVASAIDDFTDAASVTGGDDDATSQAWLGLGDAQTLAAKLLTDVAAVDEQASTRRQAALDLARVALDHANMNPQFAELVGVRLVALAELSPAQAVPLHLERARAAVAEGKMDAALEELDAALRARPDDPDILSDRGRLRTSAGDSAGAIEDLTRVAALRPDDAMVIYWLGMAKASGGDREGALADFEKTLALDPKSIEALNAIAQSHVGVGNYPLAAATVKKIVEMAPNRVDDWFRLGLMCALAGDIYASEDAFAGAIRAVPARREGMRGELVRLVEARPKESGYTTALLAFGRASARTFTPGEPRQ